jgi:hypothetical protein
MTVDTGGPIRGIIGRWLMRIQAVQGILQLAGIAVTAASTLTTALVSVGLERYAPYVLAAGVVGSPLFAYGYVELGFFNRKNREGSDRGNNFATPRDKIDDTLIGAAVFGAVHGRPANEEEIEAIKESVEQPWKDFRDGVELDDT